MIKPAIMCTIYLAVARRESVLKMNVNGACTRPVLPLPARWPKFSICDCRLPAVSTELAPAVIGLGAKGGLSGEQPQQQAALMTLLHTNIAL
jgi:hypothetical protein